MEMRKIIFDTDIGGDCDDVAALDLFISGQKQGLCDLIGLSCCAIIDQGLSCARAILREYGMENVVLADRPMGRKDRPWYGKAVTEKFPDLADFGAPSEEPVSMLRRLIAANPGVVLAVTGEFTNIAELLQSGPDVWSERSGVDLVRENVSFLAVMGGDFTHLNGMTTGESRFREDGSIMPQPEWNIICNIPAAAAVFDLCPVDVYVVPFEAGYDVISGKVLVDRCPDKPDGYSFVAHGSVQGRHSWDPMTALFAVWGDKPWFDVSPRGRVTVDEKGVTDFVPCADGKHFVLQRSVSREEIGAAIDGEIAKIL